MLHASTHGMMLQSLLQNLKPFYGQLVTLGTCPEYSPLMSRSSRGCFPGALPHSFWPCGIHTKSTLYRQSIWELSWPTCRFRVQQGNAWDHGAWGDAGPIWEHTYVMMMEVLDNLPHDRCAQPLLLCLLVTTATLYLHWGASGEGHVGSE